MHAAGGRGNRQTPFSSGKLRCLLSRQDCRRYESGAHISNPHVARLRCASRLRRSTGDAAARAHAVQALSVELPDNTPVEPKVITSRAPRTIGSVEPITYWDITLPDTMRIALQNSTVVRDLGGRVVDAPGTTPTAFDPSIVNSNPRFGVDQALSYFDPTLDANVQFNRYRQEINYQGRYVNGFQDQNLANATAGINKRFVNGGQMFFRSLTDFDANNAIQNQFPHSYTQQYQVGVVQPLLRGRGELYNLVNGASTNQDLLLNNGVLIARLNTNVADLDFEAAIQQLVSDIEDRYWELSLAYAQLQAAVSRRDISQALWCRFAKRCAPGCKAVSWRPEPGTRGLLYRACRSADLDDRFAHDAGRRVCQRASCVKFWGCRLPTIACYGPCKRHERPRHVRLAGSFARGDLRPRRVAAAKDPGQAA